MRFSHIVQALLISVAAIGCGTSPEKSDQRAAKEQGGTTTPETEETTSMKAGHGGLSLSVDGSSRKKSKKDVERIVIYIQGTCYDSVYEETEEGWCGTASDEDISSNKSSLGLRTEVDYGDEEAPDARPDYYQCTDYYNVIEDVLKKKNSWQVELPEGNYDISVEIYLNDELIEKGYANTYIAAGTASHASIVMEEVPGTGTLDIGIIRASDKKKPDPEPMPIPEPMPTPEPVPVRKK